MSSPAERAEITAVAVLAHHALVEIRCDHDAGQDLPVCNCALVDLGWHPTVQVAKEAWARHVLEVLRAGGLVVLDKQQAETVRRGMTRAACDLTAGETAIDAEHKPECRKCRALALLSAGKGPK